MLISAAPLSSCLQQFMEIYSVFLPEDVPKGYLNYTFDEIDQTNVNDMCSVPKCVCVWKNICWNS